MVNKHLVFYSEGSGFYKYMFWDDVVNKHIDEFRLTVHEVAHDQIVEIDTVSELEEVRKRLG